jgi:hypothetical protein
MSGMSAGPVRAGRRGLILSQYRSTQYLCTHLRLVQIHCGYRFALAPCSLLSPCIKAAPGPASQARLD